MPDIVRESPGQLRQIAKSLETWISMQTGTATESVEKAKKAKRANQVPFSAQGSSSEPYAVFSLGTLFCCCPLAPPWDWIQRTTWIWRSFLLKNDPVIENK